jgi:hypothetical protein
MTHSSTIGVSPKRTIEDMIKPLPYLLLVLLCCASGAVPAHEGHHEAAAEAAAAAPTASDTGLDTPQIELVVQREGADIVFYLDDYASNAPLQGLQVSVRSGTLTLQAAPSGEGSYRIAGDLIGGDSAQPLQISVHGAGIDAQLQAVLPAAPAAESVGHDAAARQRDQPGRGWILAAGFAAVLLAGGAWWRRRRREGRALRGAGAA